MNSETASMTQRNTNQVHNLEAENVALGDFHQDVTTDNWAMGDINQTIYHQQPSFLEVDLTGDDVEPSPTFLPDVSALLETRKLIVLKGNDFFDVSSFGKQLAKVLEQKHTHLSTIELVENEENKSLFEQLNQQTESRIVILNSLHPRHIQYDFEKLITLCERNNAFYIVITDSSLDTWLKSGQILKDFWFQIPEFAQYNQVELKEWFLNKLEANRPLFLSEEESISERTLFSENINVNEILQQVSTPQKLTVFLAIVRNRKHPLSDSKLTESLQNLNKNSEDIIAKWFNNLDHSQKVIAISASLFNGLFCSQYFEILTEISNSPFWDKSTRVIGSLDYFNIEFLLTFYRFETTDEGDLLVAKNPFVRPAILRAAIDHYPRHIEKALVTFMNVMENTYQRGHTKWELYGTTQRRSLIRQVFIETARDIGLYQLGNIESIYLQLAASNHSYIQGIAAKSIAQYRMFDQDELLFQTIEKWQTSKRIQDRIDLFLREKTDNKQETIAAIKTTTIRMLAYAADYDQPNQLHEKIIDNLITYSNDSDQKVQATLASVLPKFIHHHAYQLRNYLFDHFMIHDVYSSAISDGLFVAYRDYPERMKEVMLHWISICQKENSKENRRQKTTQRDNRLIVLIETLMKIPELEIDRGFSTEEMYELAIELLKQEGRAKIVDMILSLIAGIQSINYELAYKNLDSILAFVSREQRKLMTQLWVLNYMKEREHLRGADFEIVINGVSYPVWEKPDERPLTQLEEALFQWLNSGKKRAQEFATLTFLEIAHSFERKEYELIRNHIKERELKKHQMRTKQNVAQIMHQTATVPHYIGLDFWLRFRIFFYLLFESRLTKEKLKDIIMVFQSAKYSKEDLRFVIHKWNQRKRGELSTKLAKWLIKLFHNIKE